MRGVLAGAAKVRSLQPSKADCGREDALNRYTLAAAALAAVALGALASGLAPTPGLAAAQERWAGEAAQVDASLAALEDRLLANQARVRLWEEMRSRHQSVAQVACENLGEHARALVASSTRIEEQARAHRQSRLASAPTGAAR
jgi:hypothetical protein